MLDLDHFKELNDTVGHQAGDEVLQAVSDALKEAVRSTDTVYRYGGEELVVLVPESAPDAVAELAERLRAVIENLEVPLVGRSVKVTASFGVATPGGGALTPTSLLAAADAALYAAKRSGRNAVVVAGDRPGIPA